LSAVTFRPSPANFSAALPGLYIELTTLPDKRFWGFRGKSFLLKFCFERLLYDIFLFGESLRARDAVLITS
jgi:hypothetical protein